MRESSLFQILLLFYINLAMTIYIGYSQPFLSSSRNKLELFNEFHFASICYMTLIFTDFVPSVEQHYDGGWMLIALVLNYFFINMAIVIRSLLKSIFLIMEKSLNMIERKVKTFIEERAK